LRYSFDVRFRTSRPIDSTRLEIEIKSKLFERPLRLWQPSGTARDENWLGIEARGYATFDEARDSSSRLKDALLISAAKSRIGVDFMAYGVFPEGQVDLVDPGRPLPEPLRASDLVSMVTTAAGSIFQLTSNQRIAADLVNSSFFEISDEARFLLRVSAVEALCPQASQPEAFRDLSATVKASIPEASPQDRRELEEALNRVGARQSARSAYMSKIKELLGDAKAKQFDTLYGRRSNFLHDGEGRGTFGEAAQAALEISLELLFAEFRSAEDQPR
jgi:hypothetical protein